MNKHKSNIGFSCRKSITKSRANSFRLVSIISALVFLSLAIWLVFYGGKRKVTAIAATQQQAETKQPTLMPKLEGDKARDYLKEQGLSDSLSAAITKARYKVRPVETKNAKTENAQFEAGNPKNDYRAAFKSDGTTELQGGGKNRSWKTSFKLLKFGRGENLKTVAAGSWQASESRAENRRDQITEWYENKPSGLEHGFTIDEKPEAAASETQQLRVAMKIGGNLRARLDEQGQLLSLGNQVLQYSKLKVLDAEGAELSARMRLQGGELTIEVDDSKAVYPVTIDPVFEPIKKITASDGAAGDFFGVSVSISGDTAIVGADGDDGYKGAAYIFERNQGGANNWGEVKKLTGSGTTQPAGDTSVSNFGYSVSISGDTAVVGMNALVQDSYAWIFERNAGGANNWGEVKKIRHDELFEFDWFGYSVSISGDTVIVGAWYGQVGMAGGSEGGRAYIFERNKGGANNWGQVEMLVPSDSVIYDWFGYSVSISGDTVIVGNPKNFNNLRIGSAYIFERNTGGADNWGEVKKITASDGAVLDNFGYSVSISNDIVVIGAFNDDNSKGSAYIYERNAGGMNNWGEVKKLTASDGAANDQFGISVSISVDTVIVGASGDDSSKGSAYIYERNTGGADNWGEVKKLTASDGAAGDEFGFSVSISGDTAIVGAPGDDNVKGSAHIFAATGTDWVEIKKPVASDGSAGDFFGYSVSISGDTAIVGTPWDDSQKGAAYIFERNTVGANNWGEVKKLTGSGTAAGNQFGYSVSISGDTAVVGMYSEASYAWIFERNTGGANNWGEVKKLTADLQFAGSYFGSSVSISGDTVIVGAYAPGGAGAHSSDQAYIFERNKGGANNWGQVKTLTTPNPSLDALNEFGYSVSISGDTAIVSTPFDNAPNNNQGSAYVFERNQGGADNWGVVKKITSSDGAASDFFGYSVSISGEVAIVGAFGDDSQKGAAYIFERNTGGMNNWGEVKKLTASDGAANDQFGLSVSISVDTVIVGAGSDDSSKGSAYIFERNTGGADNWGEVKKLTVSDGASGDEFGYSVSISGDTAIVGAPGDDNGKGSAYIFNAVASCPTIILSPSSLPNGTVGSSYSQTVSASGGGGPYSFAVTNGSLPSGLSLNPTTGEITGTPTSSGTFNFTVTATGANDCSGSQAYSITIDCPTITVNPSSLPNGTAGSPYNQTISASGLSGSFTFAVTGGSLPNGLSLNPSTGVISGTPSTTGTFNFTVTATHASGCEGSRSYSITIDCPMITVSPSSLPNAAVGSPYSQTVSASGGVGSYTFSVTSGSLPSGLSLNPNTGEISGTPDMAGTFGFTITATDANGCMGSRAYSNFTVATQQYQFSWFYYSGLLLSEQQLNQVTAGSDVPVRFTLNGYKGNPYSQPPTSQPISCSTLAPTGPATVINRYAPDPYYSSLYDFYQTTWRTQASWKFTCRRLTLYFNDGTTRSLNFYFK